MSVTVTSAPSLPSSASRKVKGPYPEKLLIYNPGGGLALTGILSVFLGGTGGGPFGSRECAALLAKAITGAYRPPDNRYFFTSVPINLSSLYITCSEGFRYVHSTSTVMGVEFVIMSNYTEYCKGGIALICESITISSWTLIPLNESIFVFNQSHNLYVAVNNTIEI